MEYYLDALDLIEAIDKDLPNNRRSTLSIGADDTEVKKDDELTKEEKDLIKKAKRAASILIH